MTKRICFIRQSVYPYELSFRREVETLRRTGYETHVITMRDRRGEHRGRREEVIDGVYVHRLPVTRRRGSTLRYLYDYLSFFVLAALKVTALHLRHPFDAVQVNTMPDFLVFAAAIPKLLGARVTVMMQEPVPELWQTLRDTPPPLPVRWAERAAIAWADHAFTVTQQLKEAFVQRGSHADKISVILNVPEPRFLSLATDPPPPSADGDSFTLICHGAIEERYGHDTMLEAVARVRPHIPGLRLRILGAGSYVEQFLALRARLGLEDCVDYLGWVSLERMVQELRAADVGIVAQKSSPYSNLVHTNKMYEYIALGKPVLASRLRAVQAYFDEDALCYFTPADPQSLADGILALYRDPARRQRLAENAYRLYQHYRWDRQKEVYLSVYRRLLERTPQRKGIV